MGRGTSGIHAHLDLHFVQLHQRLELCAALFLRAAVLAAILAVGRRCSAQPLVRPIVPLGTIPSSRMQQKT